MSIRDPHRTVSAPGRCLWCGQPFEPRHTGGSPRVFCTSGCRTAFHSAARRWAEQAVAAGLLTVAELRSGDPAACTLLPGGETLSAEPEAAEVPRDVLRRVIARLRREVRSPLGTGISACISRARHRCRRRLGPGFPSAPRRRSVCRAGEHASLVAPLPAIGDHGLTLPHLRGP